MRRREFCRTAMTAGIAAAFPSLYACDRGMRDARQADTAIRGISLAGAELELESAAVRELGESITGTVLIAGDADYDSARKIWNGMHDKRPALIARCLNASDVSNAVTFARERELLTAVRGGGHSWPGNSVCNDGLMIDLSAMNAVSVNAQQRRGTAGGGTLLYGLDTAALEQGLVTTAGVVSHTGVGGFTLGGGFGRLNRKFGLAVDNLRAAEIVTADGRIRTVSATEEPDLFWAIRGGGGNFGVVTSFTYELYPFQRNVLSGNIVWPVAQARDVLEYYAEWLQRGSDELYIGPTMATMPDGTGIVLLEVVYNGDPASGEREVAALRRLGTPIDDGIKIQDYMVMQTQEDATFAPGIRSYVKSGMVGQMTQALVDAMIDAYVSDPRLAIFTHTAGGAVKRVAELDTAFPHRNAETMLGVGGGWNDPADDEPAIAQARAWYAKVAPFTGGYYDNIDFDRSATTGNYGPAYSRLSRIKAQVDPMNLFRLNSNILPAT